MSRPLLCQTGDSSSNVLRYKPGHPGRFHDAAFRQDQYHACAMARRTLSDNIATLQSSQRLGDGKAKPRPLMDLRDLGVDLAIGRECFFQLRRVHADAGIGNIDFQPSAADFPST